MSSTIASFHSAPKGRSYFTEFTLSKAILYGVSLSYVIFVALAAIKEPFTALPCDDEQNNLNSTQREFAQPYYDGNPCRQQRYLPLFFLTRDECSYGRRYDVMPIQERKSFLRPRLTFLYSQLDC